MEISKATLTSIVLLIHMALTGIMLFRLFKLKQANGGQLIITFFALMIPIIGPSAMIYYYDKKLKNASLQNDQKSVHPKIQKRK